MVNIQVEETVLNTYSVEVSPPGSPVDMNTPLAGSKGYLSPRNALTSLQDVTQTKAKPNRQGMLLDSVQLSIRLEVCVRQYRRNMLI